MSKVEAVDWSRCYVEACLTRKTNIHMWLTIIDCFLREAVFSQWWTDVYKYTQFIGWMLHFILMVWMKFDEI